MAKFKVGDAVKIISLDRTGACFGVRGEMGNIGDVMIVDRCESGDIWIDGYIYHEDDLEKFGSDKGLSEIAVEQGDKTRKYDALIEFYGEKRIDDLLFAIDKLKTASNMLGKA